MLKALHHDKSSLAQEQPYRADVVVALAGGSDRAAYAALLVQQGVAKRAASTLIDPRCQPVGADLRACATGVRNTVDEAIFMRGILEEDHVRRATIVTSPDHFLRASAVFTIVFAGSGVDLDFASPPSSKSALASVTPQELAKLFPSIGAAIVGRVAPDLYQKLMHYRYKLAIFGSHVRPCSS